MLLNSKLLTVLLILADCYCCIIAIDYEAHEGHIPPVDSGVLDGQRPRHKRRDNGHATNKLRPTSIHVFRVRWEQASKHACDRCGRWEGDVWF